MKLPSLLTCIVLISGQYQVKSDQLMNFLSSGMQDLDDPCQGIVLPPYGNYMDLARKLQILNEALLEHGITTVSRHYLFS